MPSRLSRIIGEIQGLRFSSISDPYEGQDGGDCPTGGETYFGAKGFLNMIVQAKRRFLRKHSRNLLRDRKMSGYVYNSMEIQWKRFACRLNQNCND